jgi:transposase
LSYQTLLAGFYANIVAGFVADIDTNGFVLLPRRWVVERTFAWLGRNRRLAKGWEKSIESAEAWLLIASIQLLTRRIASD